MATYLTYTDKVGDVQQSNREDLTDIIYDISPTDTPFMSTVGQSKAKGTYHEWQTDSLADATDDNAAIEGADAVYPNLTPTTRVGNYTQIMQKTVQVSNTQDTVDKAGKVKETAYQLTKASAELKRDIEKTLLSDNAQDAGSSATPRKLGGIQTWLTTNTVAATGAFTEPLLKESVLKAYTEGGTPTMLLVSPKQKQVVSEFEGIAAQRYEAPKSSATTIIGAADVYLSDFGTLSVVPDRFLDDEVALVLDPTMFSVAYLRPFKQTELAKTGDSTKHQMLTELTLQVKNEASSAMITGLT
jgi:hypothetical protein